jgi:hypothetical protein
MRIAIIGAALLFGTASASADETACLTAALSDYVKTNAALVMQSTPVMSVEATIAQRRLEEQYCLRVAQCRVSGLTRQATEWAAAAAFSSCLNDEAKEHLSK